MKYQLGQWLFDSEKGVLIVDGQEQKLRLKMLQLLLKLIEQSNQLVTRQQLIEEIWHGNYLVGEKALNSVVYSLRSIFKAIDPEAKVIETLPKRGYRLLLEVSQWQENEPEQKVIQNGRQSLWDQDSIKAAFLGGFVVLGSMLAVTSQWLV